MDNLKDIANRPALTTSPHATVFELCQKLQSERVGALAVIDGDRLVGIVSERDVVMRVVVARRDPEKTTVGDIMTSPVQTANSSMSVADALETMHRGQFRHLPLVDGDGKLVGMLSVRNLLRERVSQLDLQNVDLVNFISADGAGG